MYQIESVMVILLTDKAIIVHQRILMRNGQTSKTMLTILGADSDFTSL